ncbi:hypothetical protein BH11PSE2_BH11PSE2_15600 [soil metagenome]
MTRTGRALLMALAFTLAGLTPASVFAANPKDDAAAEAKAKAKEDAKAREDAKAKAKAGEKAKAKADDKQEAEAATAFLKKLYASYRREDFSPLKNNGKRYFDASLVSLIREDARLSGDEVGALDFDPVCQCQDPEGMKATVHDAKLTGGKSATAKVELKFDKEDEIRITYVLVQILGQWRIHDIENDLDRSLRQFLTKANLERAAELKTEKAK